jgi:hypothetical protein
LEREKWPVENAALALALEDLLDNYRFDILQSLLEESQS